jgi:cell division protein FtsB
VPDAKQPAASKKPAAKKPVERKPAAKKPAARKPATKKKPDRGRRGAVVRAALGSVVLVGLLFAFVYPTRTFLDQRSDTNKARAQLELLQSESRRLAREAEQLRSDAEIERRAREYGLVQPGERPFVVIPAPTTVVTPSGDPNPAP